jgi:hypothetical protein
LELEYLGIVICDGHAFESLIQLHFCKKPRSGFQSLVLVNVYTLQPIDYECVYSTTDEILDGLQSLCESLKASIPLHALFSPDFALSFFAPHFCPFSSASTLFKSGIL